ncbi:MAG: hypothetical protein WA971_14635 [Microbacterium sp.]
MAGFVLKFLLILLVVMLGVIALLRMRRPAARHDEKLRQRMPRAVLLAGGALVLVGVGLGIVGFMAPRTGADPLPMRIASIAAVLLGLSVLWMHRNRYVEAAPAWLRVRTLLGRERTIAYADVTAHRVGRWGRLTLHAADGTTITVYPAFYDLSPVVAGLRR